MTPLRLSLRRHVTAAMRYAADYVEAFFITMLIRDFDDTTPPSMPR